MNDPRLPATRPGKRKKPDVFEQTDIRRAVEYLLQTDFSNVRSVVLESLYHYVALTETSLFQLTCSQVAISANIESFSRTLRRYKAKGLIKTVPYEVMKKVQRAGYPMTDTGHLLAYTLGPVGEAYARRNGWNGENPFQSVPGSEYLAHDLICAEVILKMQQLWEELPEEKRGLIEASGPRSVFVWDTESKRAIVKPDGLFIKRKLNHDFERAFLVEYQNVRALIQVQNKIKKYEQIARYEYRWVWDLWGLDEMPWVLVIYRQEATLRHYQEQLELHGELRAKYACTSLADIWAGRLSIKPILKKV
jgi:hypothetical protein